MSYLQLHLDVFDVTSFSIVRQIYEIIHLTVSRYLPAADIFHIASR